MSYLLDAHNQECDDRGVCHRSAEIFEPSAARSFLLWDFFLLDIFFFEILPLLFFFYNLRKSHLFESDISEEGAIGFPFFRNIIGMLFEIFSERCLFLIYILMVILHLPYTALISTIVGVTNIIPFFGPFIGAIPSAVLICVISPLKALYFLIMILGLQQFDGNILGPKILGDSTGLASFWVMFAIIVGGGLFGVAGMVLGVPTFAIITYYFDRNTGKRLRSKGYKDKTEEYIDFNVYDADRKDILK